MARRMGQGADWSEGHGSGGCRGNGQQPAVAGQGEFLDRALAAPGTWLDPRVPPALAELPD